jgi:hypothetical protein
MESLMKIRTIFEPRQSGIIIEGMMGGSEAETNRGHADTKCKHIHVFGEFMFQAASGVFYRSKQCRERGEQAFLWIGCGSALAVNHGHGLIKWQRSLQVVSTASLTYVCKSTIPPYYAIRIVVEEYLGSVEFDSVG